MVVLPPFDIADLKQILLKVFRHSRAANKQTFKTTSHLGKWYFRQSSSCYLGSFYLRTDQCCKIEIPNAGKIGKMFTHYLEHLMIRSLF